MNANLWKLDVRAGEAGLWHATSADHPPLRVTEKSREELFRQIPLCVEAFVRIEDRPVRAALVPHGADLYCAIIAADPAPASPGSPPEPAAAEHAPYIDIVFDGPASHESGRFIEVEDASGKSIKFGEWVERNDGYWALRIPHRDHLFEEMRKALGYAATALRLANANAIRDLEGTGDDSIFQAPLDTVSAVLAKVEAVS